MSDFIVFFNLFGESDHFEDWDEAEEEDAGGIKQFRGKHKENHEMSS